MKNEEGVRKAGMKRREAVKLIAIGGAAGAAAAGAAPAGAAQHAGHGGRQHGAAGAEAAGAAGAVAAGDYTPEYFSPHEFAVISRLADLIIPRDDTPGALDAGVPEYIDAMVAHMPAAQVRLSGGIQWLDRHCGEQFGKPFLECAAAEQRHVLDLLSQRAGLPRSLRPARAFFVQVRDLACDGFYSSKLGFEELGYKGNVFVTGEYTGCTHAEHE
jgi:gluconate 2-dehydrogenase gamma chain